MNAQRIAAVVSKEWREILRDRLYLGLAFVLPFVFMILFGYGLSFDVEEVPLAVVDHDRSPLSRDYAYRFIHSRYFDFRGYVQDERDLDALFGGAMIRVALVIPPGFERDLGSGRATGVLSVIDGVFPERAGITRGYVTAINAAFRRELIERHLSDALGVSVEQARALIEPVRLEVRYLYNEAARSIWSIAPKLLSVILLIASPFLTALAIVREKETGSIYNIYSSTLTRGEFLLGKLIPYAVIAFANSLILWALATGLYGAPFKGGLALFLAASALYAVCAAGVGMLVSLMVRTQMAALVVTVILTIVPAVNYSGLFVPISSLDPQTRVIAHLFPALFYTNINLGVFLKGVGLEVLWSDVAALALYATVVLAMDYLLFRKRVKA